jgi:hypothetical protein
MKKIFLLGPGLDTFVRDIARISFLQPESPGWNKSRGGNGVRSNLGRRRILQETKQFANSVFRESPSGKSPTSLIYLGSESIKLLENLKFHNPGKVFHHRQLVPIRRSNGF